ncbi:hypothetical protein [Blastococcus goldschmidtiae]|uniref:DUF5666 domain-containing protein n=1 Tax=Blastococcus goldschmidtiae TaxID=3075546 RepID=A0ABU2K5K2_9ACTN|nr:hypothetical protein [Blastococcus sp. DSM 46792]MDT0275472.1 hypothetical protein [Blastococcus sp. DSM 46792]
MPSLSPRRPAGRRPTIAVLLAAAVAALPACSEDTVDAGTGSDAPDVRGPDDLQDPYDGEYGEDFRDDIAGYEGQEVTLEAAVDQVISPVAFTITAPDGDDVEPTLVIVEEPVIDLAPGAEVVVAGVPHEEFDLAAVEEELGAELPEEELEEWDDEPYVLAGIVEPAPAA